MTLRHALFLFVLLAAVGACAPRQPHAVVGLLEDGVAAFVAQHPLAAGQVVRVDEVARTPAASYHVVQARGAESPHRHLVHDLTVHMLSGGGVLRLARRRVTLRAGDVVLIARGVTHWFTPAGESRRWRSPSSPRRSTRRMPRPSTLTPAATAARRRGRAPRGGGRMTMAGNLRLLLIAGTAAGLLAAGSVGWAADSVTGEVVDLACYLPHGSKGASHRKCADTCAKKGMPLGLLTDDNQLYLVLEDHENPKAYAQVKEKAAEKITIEGQKVTRDGMNAIVAEAVK